MRIALLNYEYLALPTPKHLLARFAPLQWQAEGLQQAGAEVYVFQRFHTSENFVQNGVVYHFWADRLPAELRLVQIPATLHQAVKQLQLDVVHGHGLRFPLQVAALRQSLSARTSLLVQQHSELPGHPIKNLLQRLCFRGVDAFLFPTAGMAAAWRRARVLGAQPVHIVQECSRPMQPGDKAAARATTGMRGDPAVLWMARLVQHKDPLTVLNGFEQVAQVLPEIRLYMGHGHADPLLAMVRTRIAQSYVLQRAVILLGEIARADLDAYYQSTDYFVSGSTRYGGIIALLEALGCGAVPIVTDIEAYRNMTDDGRIGALWQPGIARSFADALLGAVQNKLHTQHCERAIAYFNQHLSLSAVSENLMAVYAETQHKK